MDPVTEVRLPVPVAVQFAHAAAQVIADESAVDLLHIKGPSVDESLLDFERLEDPVTGHTEKRPIPRNSSDADVLVRPQHVDSFVTGLLRHGWTLKVDFRDGSAFEHAATFEHPYLKHLDVHRRFPGIGADPDHAFDVLWADRGGVDIAGIDCVVPSICAQRLILILHAARGPVANHRDIRRAWEDADGGTRLEVQRLAVALRAEVGLAAGTGRLAQFRGAREYDLWRLLSEGNYSLLEMWWARVRAQPSVRARCRLAVKLAVPNVRRLRSDLGLTPTAREVASAYVTRLRLASAETEVAVRHRLRKLGK